MLEMSVREETQEVYRETVIKYLYGYLCSYAEF